MKTLVAKGDNPFCGDSIQVSVDIENGYISCAQWEGYGCSLCEASADHLMQIAQEKSIAEVKRIAVEDIIEVVSNVPIGRTRIKCVALPLKALQDALSKEVPQE